MSNQAQRCPAVNVDDPEQPTCGGVLGHTGLHSANNGVWEYPKPATEYAVMGDWLVESIGRHTCGTGPNGHYGHHEPGCGWEPIATIEDVFAALSAVAATRPEVPEETDFDFGWDSP